MKNRIALVLTTVLFQSFILTAQVQVSKEPRHKNVLENKYIRLLDVWLQPGDTTLFHIHSTPSVFVHFTNTVVCSQIKNKEWATNQNTKGNASYRSFVNDTLVHKVSNCDTVPFHVTDIELLSPYIPATKLQPLPFTVLFENEKVFAYRLTDSSFTTKLISNRGPIVAELVAGEEVLCYDVIQKKQKRIKTGKYLYIKPGSSFYLSAAAKEKTVLVLFEIK